MESSNSAFQSRAVGRGFGAQRGVRVSRRVMRDRTAVYHVMSRTVRKHFWLDDRAKEMFRKMLRKQEAFTGVDVLAYCLMNNHFHLLLRVPEYPLKEDGEHLIDDAEILRRYGAYYGDDKTVASGTLEELRAALEEGGEVAEYARRRVLARMGDLSAFMRELKQRFAFWFNDKNECCGTIWSERFKSVPVENTPLVLTRVAAYIDLNPVRARLVRDPKDYRYSGYGAAMRGGELAQEGLRGLYAGSDFGLRMEALAYREALREYRRLLYQRGAAPGEQSKGGGDISEEAARRVQEASGEVSVAEALSCRVREFSESIVLGSEDFVADCLKRWSGGKHPRVGRWRGWQRILGALS